MPRIRTIKPEFPQSESMGRVGREARLLFILIWTQADDSGRLRANSRMLASVLFPYDQDVFGLIDGWIIELEREDCLFRYEADGLHYIQICNWLNHQKIDHASPSKIPAPREDSRELAKNTRSLAPDQGSRTKDQGSWSVDGSAPASPAPREDSRKKAPRGTSGKNRIPPDFSISESVRTWAAEKGFTPYLDLHLEFFKNYAHSQNKLYADWDGGFRNCILSDWGGVRQLAIKNGSTRNTTLPQKTCQHVDAGQVCGMSPAKESALYNGKPLCGHHEGKLIRAKATPPTAAFHDVLATLKRVSV